MTSTLVAPRRIGGAVAPSTAFRPDIEGLRAIAVLAVVAFHAGVPGLQGGFVGVDVFFVISGFLITGILVRESLATGRIDFRRFYARRARRILPAASLVLVATAIVAWLVLPPLAGLTASYDVLAAAVFAVNWRYIALGTDYLAVSTEHSPVLHFWSLAVEEQFYVVWPLLILLAVWLARRRGRAGFGPIAVVLGVATLASFALSWVQTTTDPGLAYMATTTRAWEFGVGGLLALAVGRLARLQHAAPRVGALVWLTGWAGAGAIVAGSIVFDGSTPFPGTAALVPTLGTAAVIAAGAVGSGGQTAVGAVLSTRVARFIGRVSFSWYLWHWPFIVLAEAFGGELDWPTRCALMVAAFAVATVTYSVVERPLNDGPTFKRRSSSAIALGLAAITMAASTSLVVGTNRAQDLQAMAPVTAAAASFDSIFGPDSGVHSGPVSPSPLLAVTDVPEPEWCLLDGETVPDQPCVVGTGSTEVVLFGDSHAHQWLPALTPIAAERDWHLTIMTKAGCPVAALQPTDFDARFADPDCLAWRAASIDAIADLHPAIVIVSGLSSYVSDTSAMADGWTTSLDGLAESDAELVYIRDTPKPTQDVPTCMSGALDDWTRCAFAFDAVLRNEPVADRGFFPGLAVLDLTSYLCDGGVCPAARNGALLYRDDSHLTATVSEALSPAVDEELIRSGVVERLAG